MPEEMLRIAFFFHCLSCGQSQVPKKSFHLSIQASLTVRDSCHVDSCRGGGGFRHSFRPTGGFPRSAVKVNHFTCVVDLSSKICLSNVEVTKPVALARATRLV